MIFVEKSKNDQGRQGHTRVLGASTELQLCPLAWFVRYSQMRPMSALRFSQMSGARLATTTPSHVLKRWITKFGFSAVSFSSHSARRGGVTAAAAHGVQRRLLMRHGNWHSDAVDIYIDDSLLDRLSVSRAIAAA